jgi:hypothetical protein
MVFKKRRIIKPQSFAGQFALCESVTATGTSPRHIRVLKENGMKAGGGADTDSLCGRPMAWDLSIVTATEIHNTLPYQHQSSRYCSNCVEIMTGISAEAVRSLVKGD